jgi:predicted DNA-binding transcriptional regulator AlpA
MHRAGHVWAQRRNSFAVKLGAWLRMTNVQQVNTTNPPTGNPFGLQKAAYSVDETIEVLSIGRSSLYALVERGEIKPVKLGKKTLWAPRTISAFDDFCLVERAVGVLVPR